MHFSLSLWSYIICHNKAHGSSVTGIEIVFVTYEYLNDTSTQPVELRHQHREDGSERLLWWPRDLLDRPPVEPGRHYDTSTASDTLEPSISFTVVTRKLNNSPPL